MGGVGVEEEEVIEYKSKQFLIDHQLLLTDEIKQSVEVEKYYLNDRQIYLRSVNQINFTPEFYHSRFHHILELIQAKTITNSDQDSEFDSLYQSLLDDHRVPNSIRISENSQWGVPLPIFINN